MESCSAQPPQPPSDISPDPPSKAITRWAMGLVWLTLLYNVLEAVAAIYFGLETESISLLGFGLDSVIELSASLLVLWHLITRTPDQDDTHVRRWIGYTFLALAAYVLWQAGLDLWSGQEPKISPIGIAITLLSAVIMPILANLKLKAADALQNQALRMEAKETLACAGLSIVVLIGLSLNALFGWWWADPIAAIFIVPWLVREGLEGIRGESCCGCSQ